MDSVTNEHRKAGSFCKPKSRPKMVLVRKALVNKKIFSKDMLELVNHVENQYDITLVLVNRMLNKH